MMFINAENLHAVVVKLCPTIQEMIRLAHFDAFEEDDLIYEMVCCILSSRVPFNHARAMTARMKELLLLDSHVWMQNPYFEEEILSVLMESIEVDGKLRKYRFPRVRAQQIGKTQRALADIGGGLRALISESSDAADARRRLVGTVSGFGPKQASMFLRNIGFSSDLAILDAHIMRFGQLTGLFCGQAPTSLGQYERLEFSFRGFATTTGFSVGCVDSAVWITMQAARGESLVWR